MRIICTRSATYGAEKILGLGIRSPRRWRPREEGISGEGDRERRDSTEDKKSIKGVMCRVCRSASRDGLDGKVWGRSFRCWVWRKESLERETMMSPLENLRLNCVGGLNSQLWLVMTEWCANRMGRVSEEGKLWVRSRAYNVNHLVRTHDVSVGAGLLFGTPGGVPSAPAQQGHKIQ